MVRFAAFAAAPRPLRLQCGVQHYDWGQRGPGAFIPNLLGLPPRESTPYAELWIGAHPVKPAQVEVDGATVSLAELIEAAPAATLGAAGVARHGPRLPFLLKVLAAERMLSIQAHPNRAQARAGFAREDAAGIPRDADHRNYRDDNHKPELIVALTEFHALSGFREDVADLPRRFPEIAAFGATSVEAAFTAILSQERAVLDRTVETLVTRLARDDAERAFEPHQHEYWMLRADRQFTRDGRRDPGVLALPLLNLVRLEPGQGLFLDAGELHSYLEGVGVELMANSDNVLRGGLTPKHVDVAELRRVLTFRTGPARPIGPGREGGYETPAEEFALAALALPARGTWTAPPTAVRGPDLLLVLEGAARLTWTEGEMPLRRGDAVFVPKGVVRYAIEADTASSRVFRATTP